MEWKGTRMALVAVLAAVLQTISAEPQSLTSPNSSSVPMFAGVKGDGTNVGFSWWAVKGAISYELVRTLHPHQKPVTLASLPRTTLGYLDKNAGTGPLYYQLVALGPSGSRVAGAWFQYVAPTVESASGVGGDVLVVWSGVPKAPGGYEVWRAIDPNQRPLRVGAVSQDTVNYLDKHAGNGPFSYQVIAIGGTTRAASSWFGFNTGSNAITNAGVLARSTATVTVAGSAGTQLTDQASAIALQSRWGQALDQGKAAQEAQLAAQLAQELSNVGINLQPQDVNDLANAITRGGPAGTAIAEYIVMAIAGDQVDTAVAGAQAQPQQFKGSTAFGDPTQQPDAGGTTAVGDLGQQSNQGGTLAGNTTQLSQQQIAELMTLLSSGHNSTLQISQILVSKLKQLTKK